MMYGRGKSDSVIVAVKPTNKAERSAAEPAEPRAEAKGNAGQQSMDRMQSRGNHGTGAGAHTTSRNSRFAVIHLRWEPYAGKPHVRICAGGAQQ
jgi:hypothetical protein